MGKQGGRNLVKGPIRTMFSTGAGSPGTFHGMFAFQHRHASLRCDKIVFALLALIPSGIMSRMSCITAARSSNSKCDSMRCFVTVFATPLEWRPSNCLASRFPNHRSNKGTIPRRKKSHTRHIGAQKPTPGPFPTGPVLNR